MQEFWLRWLLRWRSRPAPVVQHLRRKRMRPNPAPPKVGAIRVAAVQMTIGLDRSAIAFADRIHRFVTEAVAAGAELVAFPEYVGVPLLGLIPGVSDLSDDVRLDAAVGSLGDGLALADLFYLAGPAAWRIYDTVFRTLARGFGVTIAAGSLFVPSDDGRVFNRAYLYGPDGRLLLSQGKAHLMPIETEWEISTDTTLQVVETPLGVIGLPVCMDASFFETFRLLRLLGAEIAVLPIADMTYPYSDSLALRGIWPRVQESQLYGIKSAMVGEVHGLRFTGKAGVYAPLALTPNGDGVLAESAQAEGDTIVVTDLDLGALRTYRSEHPLDLNLGLLRRYLPDAYPAGRR